jgi:prepilin-type N-terminal cleavage/methylation domain-containing protein
MEQGTNSGFTLIELSIVLVIIGLLTGGILAGRDLIRAAELRGQIRQIEQYRTAVHTFKVRYDGLPGDVPGQNFGFAARSGTNCSGNNDGLLLSCFNYQAVPWAGSLNLGGEATLFWSDLAAASLITGAFSTSSGIVPNVQASQMASYLPAASLGGKHFIHVFSDGVVNFFALSQFTSTTGASQLIVNYGLTAADALALDSKADDGLPVTGGIVSISSPISVQLWNRPDPSGAAGLCSNGVSYNASDNNPRCSLRFAF